MSLESIVLLMSIKCKKNTTPNEFGRHSRAVQKKAKRQLKWSRAKRKKWRARNMLRWTIMRCKNSLASSLPSFFLVVVVVVIVFSVSADNFFRLLVFSSSFFWCHVAPIVASHSSYWKHWVKFSFTTAIFINAIIIFGQRRCLVSFALISRSEIETINNDWTDKKTATKYRLDDSTRDEKCTFCNCCSAFALPFFFPFNVNFFVDFILSKTRQQLQDVYINDNVNESTKSSKNSRQAEKFFTFDVFLCWNCLIVDVTFAMLWHWMWMRDNAHQLFELSFISCFALQLQNVKCRVVWFLNWFRSLSRIERRKTKVHKFYTQRQSKGNELYWQWSQRAQSKKCIQICKLKFAIIQHLVIRYRMSEVGEGAVEQLSTFARMAKSTEIRFIYEFDQWSNGTEKWLRQLRRHQRERN